MWMSMSRDGLLPPAFQKIHEKFKTPSFATIITGLVVGVPILFTDKTFVLDFTSIATLFAFVLVCGGVLLIPRKEKVPGRFSLPYINGQFLYPLIVALSLFLFIYLSDDYIGSLFNFDYSGNPDYASGTSTFMDLATPNISLIIFWVVCVLLSIATMFKKFSLIPLMGVTTCLYLLTGMTKSNWIWFLSWLALGLVVYFIYGYKKSKLAATA
jgi:basic amino acid/polyamine antiporter, APA family